MSDFREWLQLLPLNLRNPDPTVRSDTAWVLCREASQGTRLPLGALFALGDLLSDGNADVRRAADAALGKAIEGKKNHDDALPAIVSALSTGNNAGRLLASNHLQAYRPLRLGIAVPGLARALSDGDDNLRRACAARLQDAAFGGVDISIAVEPLVLALSDKDPVTRTHAGAALDSECATGDCNSIDVLRGMEANLRKGYESTREKISPCRAELVRAGFVFSAMLGRTARRRNELAELRDIMLDERPKPPKRGTAYQELRMAVRNG